MLCPIIWLCQCVSTPTQRTRDDPNFWPGVVVMVVVVVVVVLSLALVVVVVVVVV